MRGGVPLAAFSAIETSHFSEILTRLFCGKELNTIKNNNGNINSKDKNKRERMRDEKIEKQGESKKQRKKEGKKPFALRADLDVQIQW